MNIAIKEVESSLGYNYVKINQGIFDNKLVYRISRIPREVTPEELNFYFLKIIEAIHDALYLSISENKKKDFRKLGYIEEVKAAFKKARKIRQRFQKIKAIYRISYPYTIKLYRYSLRYNK